MNQRTFSRGVTASVVLIIASFFGGLQSASAQPTSTGATRQPNIIFILADDWGWGDLGCYGHQQLKTPSLDKMAKEGTMWTNFYCNGSVCSPSRAAYMTGRFPAELGFHTIIAPHTASYGVPRLLDPKIPSVTRLLHDAGYSTAHLGKWHLGDGPGVDFKDYGIDHVVTKKGGSRPESSRRLVDETITFLDARHAKPAGERRPFYINLWLNDTHAPLNPTAEHLEAYKDRPEGPAKVYYSAATNADRHIGRLLAHLDGLGLTNDTMVIFTSDNGPEDIGVPNAQHSGAGSPGPFRGRKRSIYEGGIRVPFIVRWPGVVPAGRVDNTSVVSGVDLLPTLCALANVPLPGGLEQNGQDVSATLRGATLQRQKPLFWEWRLQIFSHISNKSPQLAMRDQQWKLLMNPDKSRIELYDLISDPGELDSVAAQNPAVVEKMQGQLLAWKASVPMGKGDPDAGSNVYPWPGTKAAKVPNAKLGAESVSPATNK